MPLKIKFYVFKYLKIMFWKQLTVANVIYLMAILKMYKFMGLGPAAIGDQWHAKKLTSYRVLESLWHFDIWPLIKWLPVAFLVDTLLHELWLKDQNQAQTEGLRSEKMQEEKA
jgi:hypothetical protein